MLTTLILLLKYACSTEETMQGHRIGQYKKEYPDLKDTELTAEFK